MSYALEQQCELQKKHLSARNDKKGGLEQVPQHRGPGMSERSMLSSRVVAHTQPTKSQTADENQEVKAVML